MGLKKKKNPFSEGFERLTLKKEETRSKRNYH